MKVILRTGTQFNSIQDQEMLGKEATCPKKVIRVIRERWFPKMPQKYSLRDNQRSNDFSMTKDVVSVALYCCYSHRSLTDAYKNNIKNSRSQAYVTAASMSSDNNRGAQAEIAN